MTDLSNVVRYLREAVFNILQSEAVVRERGRRIRESVEKRARNDWRLKGKSAEELAVIASMENFRDTRTIEDIAIQNWEHSRAQTFALYLISSQLDQLLKILRSKPEGIGSAEAASIPSERPVDLGNGSKVAPLPTGQAEASTSVSSPKPCRDDNCNGRCGRLDWDSPHVSDPTTRWQRIALHATLNRSGGSGGPGRSADTG